MKKLFKVLISLAIAICLMPIGIFAEENEKALNYKDDVYMILNNPSVSNEIKEWLLWFDGLTYEEQITINYRPAELSDYNYEKNGMI